MLSIAAAVLPLVAACTVLHVPNPDPITIDALGKLRGRASVSVRNDQPDQAIRPLGKAGFGTLTGSLHAWSEAAGTLLKQGLREAGFDVRDAGERTLGVAVREVELGVSGIDFVAAIPKCRVRLLVAAGSGYVKEVDQVNNALSPPGACDKAVSQAVIAALGDAGLAAYLKGE
jgi:hypothetical protein